MALFEDQIFAFLLSNDSRLKWKTKKRRRQRKRDPFVYAVLGKRRQSFEKRDL